jgi:hypothetical protein
MTSVPKWCAKITKRKLQRELDGSNHEYLLPVRVFIATAFVLDWDFATDGAPPLTEIKNRIRRVRAKPGGTGMLRPFFSYGSSCKFDEPFP